MVTTVRREFKQKLELVGSIIDNRSSKDGADDIQEYFTSKGLAETHVETRKSESQHNWRSDFGGEFGAKDVWKINATVGYSYSLSTEEAQSSSFEVNLVKTEKYTYSYPQGKRTARYSAVVDLPNGRKLYMNEVVKFFDSEERGTVEQQKNNWEKIAPSVTIYFLCGSGDIDHLVKDGDIVFIKSSKGFWLSKGYPRMNTYCAMATDDKKDRARFKVHFKECLDKTVTFKSKVGIQLELMDYNSYLGDNVMLYQATTGSTKYDIQRLHNSKQFWELDYDNKPNGPEGELMYGKTHKLLDMYVQSYMCVNTSNHVEANGFWDRPSHSHRYYVEGKYSRHMLDHFDNEFTFEKAEA